MNNDLMSLLYRSSHFLHHRRGGKRGQRRILTLLTQNPEISQKELQDKLGIESGSMSELVIKLEHKGLVTRTKDDTDKRMSKLTITELGLKMSKDLEDSAAGEEQLLLSSLDDGEQEQLKLLLTKLVTSWEESDELRGEGHHHKRCGHHSDHDHHHDQSYHSDYGHHSDNSHHGDHGHGEHKDHDHGDHKDHGHRDHDHHSDRSTHDGDESHHHHGQDRDLDHRGHHFSGKEHDKHHHHRHN